MAYRKQEGRSRPYFVYWTNPFTGKRESKSCKTEAEAKKLDAFIKYQLEFERETFRRPEQAESKPEQTVQTHETTMFLYLKDRQFSKSNLSYTLSHMPGVLHQYGDTPIESVDKALLAKIQASFVGSKSGTIKRRMGIIKAVLRWAYKTELIETIPLFPDCPAVKHARLVPPTPEEIAMLFAAAPDHLRRVIILGYYVGMRVGECELLRLKWADVDFSAQVIRVPNADKGSLDLWREVPINAEITALLKQWYAADIGLNVTTVVHYRGQPIRSIKTSWRRTLKRAGITRHIRPYDLRHGFATQLIANGADVGTVAELMGHSSPLMVLKHYQHVLNRQKREAIQSLPSFFGGVQCVQN